MFGRRFRSLSFCTLHEPCIGENEERELCNDADPPRERIGQKQVYESMVRRKVGIDPSKSDTANASQRDQHGRSGIAKSSQNPAQDIHDSAEAVRYADDLHTHESVGDLLLATGGIDTEKRLAQKIGADAEDKSHDRNAE